MSRKILLLLLGTGFFFYSSAQSGGQPANLAVIATPSGIDRYGGNYHELNDGLVQREAGNPADREAKPKRFSTWVEYDWPDPVSTDRIAVYWWDYTGTVPLPSAYRLEYWAGSRFQPVAHASGLGILNDSYNATSFDAMQTTRLRLEMDSADRWVAALLEWQVFEAPGAAPVAPVVTAGADRDVMLDGRTYLSGKIRAVRAVSACRWSKV